MYGLTDAHHAECKAYREEIKQLEDEVTRLKGDVDRAKDRAAIAAEFIAMEKYDDALRVLKGNNDS